MTDLTPGLYVVATPIGNLQDLSPRAAAVLRAATLVAAEDTRTAARILTLAAASPRRLSLTEHNVERRFDDVLGPALDGVVALVSDAGTPAIADPGARLVAEAHRRAVPVFAVPGPSALAAALSVSGFETAEVLFLGFLPKGRGERRARLAEAARAATVLVFFESPRRLSASLADLVDALGDPETVVCRELTKLHEEVVRARASELAARFSETRGECTVVVQVPPRPASSDDAVREYLAEMHRAGARRGPAAAEAARRFGVTRRHAYTLWPGP